MLLQLTASVSILPNEDNRNVGAGWRTESRCKRVKHSLGERCLSPDTDLQGGKQMKGTAETIHSPCESQGKKNRRFIFLMKHAFKSSKYLNGGG